MISSSIAITLLSQSLRLIADARKFYRSNPDASMHDFRMWFEQRAEDLGIDLGDLEDAREEDEE